MSNRNGKESIPHLERTAREPREKSLIPVVVQRVERVNDQVRLFRLAIPQSAQPVKFLPGQWLDVYCPGIARAGGFTLTSSPSKALRRSAARVGDGEEHEGGYLELAVARSPGNAPAAWLWQDSSSGARDPGMKREAELSSAVIGREITVRIGGRFVWPPPGIDTVKLRKVVFVAGGVGVNPLMSMLSHLAEQQQLSFEIEFFYSVKDPATAAAGNGERRVEEILFLERIAGIFARKEVRGRLRLFLTGSSAADTETRGDEIPCPSLGTTIPFERRRAAIGDVVSALASGQDGPLDTDAAVVYICGVPGMTDEFVERLTGPDGLGMPQDRVLCEKWW